MADVSRLRKNKGLGSPPGPDDVATSLSSPELAPAELKEERTSPPEVQEPAYRRPDGRSARKTNRTLAFGTRVTPEFDAEVRDIAYREGLLLVEVLENAIRLYKESKGY